MRAEPLTVLNLAVILLQIWIFAYAMQSTVPMRNPGRYTGLCLLLMTALWLLKQAAPLWGNCAAGLVMLALQLLLALPFTLISRRTTVLCALEQVTAVWLTEGIVTLVWLARQGQLPSWPEDDLRELVLMRIVCLFLLLALSQLARFFAIWAHRLPASSRKLPVALLPFSQGVILLILLYAAQEGWGGDEAGALVLLAFLGTVIADAVMFLAWRRLCREEQIREQLRLTERHLETQMQYYQNLREHIVSANRLRHDLNNHLQTAYTLIERGERNAARQQLDALCGYLKETSVVKYSSNPVMDAVLSEKAAICQRKGIGLEVTVSVPYELPVSGAHLCSLTANMMDNAIAGCSGCRSAWIEFDARIRSDCLTLRCRNAAGQQTTRKTPKDGTLLEHGLGLGILRSIAEAYDGELQTQQADGVFTTVVLLPLP